LKVKITTPVCPAMTVERLGEAWTTLRSVLLDPGRTVTRSLVPVKEVVKSVAVRV